MLKQCLLVLVAASLISIAVPFAAGQDSPSNNQQSPPYPARRTVELTKQLNLTSDQQSNVHDALQSERSQMESLRQDTSLSQEESHAKTMEIHKSTDTRIRALLDSNQRKKWDDMQAKREEWMQKHPE
jgi:protein CpxP